MQVTFHACSGKSDYKAQLRTGGACKSVVFLHGSCVCVCVSIEWAMWSKESWQWNNSEILHPMTLWDSLTPGPLSYRQTADVGGSCRSRVRFREPITAYSMSSDKADGFSKDSLVFKLIKFTRLLNWCNVGHLTTQLGVGKRLVIAFLPPFVAIFTKTQTRS